MGKFTEFNLPLRGMQPGTQTFEYVLDSEFFRNMESSDITGGEVKVSLTVCYKGDYYILDFVLKGTISIPCDRCLDDMWHNVDTTYHINVKYGPEYNDEDDKLLIIPETDAYLNIASILYDTVALTIPIMHVHAEGECNVAMEEELNKHAAHYIGDDDDMEYGTYEDDDESDDDESSLNNESDNNFEVDPRWEALKKLKDNN